MGLGAVTGPARGGSGGSPAISAEPFQFAQEDAAKAGLERPVTIDRMPPPSYPASAFENNQSGEVVLRVDVDAQGKVSDVRVLSATNPGVFDAASIAAAAVDLPSGDEGRQRGGGRSPHSDHLRHE